MFPLILLGLIGFFDLNQACAPTGSGGTPLTNPVFYMTYAPSVDMTYPNSPARFRFRVKRQASDTSDTTTEATTVATTTTTTATTTTTSGAGTTTTTSPTTTTTSPTTTTTTAAGGVFPNQSPTLQQATESAQDDVISAINSALTNYNYTSTGLTIDLSLLTGFPINIVTSNWVDGDGLVQGKAVTYQCQASMCDPVSMAGFVEIQQQLAVPVSNGPSLTLAEWQTVATRVRNTLATVNGVFFYGEIEARTG